MPSTSFTESLKDFLSDQKQPKFRYQQIVEGFYQKYYSSLDQFTNLPQSLIELLKESSLNPVPLTPLHTVSSSQSEKVLFKTNQNQLVESVYLSYQTRDENKFRHSLCVSSQSGCALGCEFCATGAVGFKQNLSADEIVGQLLHFLRQSKAVDTIVFMGMGEPLVNQESVFKAVEIITNPQIIAFSPKRITISTVGIVPGIERIIKDSPNINLAISLHHPNQKEREVLMPISKTYPIDQIFDATNAYIRATKNRVFIAYTLMKDTNDSSKEAHDLAKLIKSQEDTAYLYHVNLIRYHQAPSKTAFTPSDTATIKNFGEVLDKYHISHSLRQNFGHEIDAACGQLYATYLQKS